MSADQEEVEEAQRTARHLRATAHHVAFYGLFFVRREAWPKEKRWRVWELALSMV